MITVVSFLWLLCVELQSRHVQHDVVLKRSTEQLYMSAAAIASLDAQQRLQSHTECIAAWCWHNNHCHVTAKFLFNKQDLPSWTDPYDSWHPWHVTILHAIPEEGERSASEEEPG